MSVLERVLLYPKEGEGTYHVNAFAVGLRPRGAAGGVFRLHGVETGVFGGFWAGAVFGPFLQRKSEEGMLEVWSETKREKRECVCE